MNVPNHEKKAFRDMTPEERNAIVDALIAGDLEVDHGDGWRGNVATIHALYIYRTRPRQLVIPWQHIKDKYRWASMDDCETVWAYEFEPIIIGSRWGGGGSGKKLDRYSIDTTGIDWRESLTARPDGV